jgi:hypothetical protein
MRLHEWVAEEKGYFTAEGLDDEFTATTGGSPFGVNRRRGGSDPGTSFEEGLTGGHSCKESVMQNTR